MTEQGREPRDEPFRNWIFTIPNIICITRAIGSIVLVWLALRGQREWFVGLFVLLTMSDWIDGYLARWLHQRSDFGARIDSLADSMLFGAMLIGIVVLCREQLSNHWGWIVVAVGSYVVTTFAGLIKFGRIPSYHTWAAKKSQFVVLLAAISLLLQWAVWPLWIAASAVTLTNLEATAMTIVLSKWHADVANLRKAMQIANAEEADAPDV